MENITLYTQPGCGPCMVVKRFLEARGVDFTVKNIRQDAEALAEITKLGYMATPVLVTPAGATYGFNPDKITELIAGA